MDDTDDKRTHPEELTLLDYVIGELGPDSSDQIRRHVETCPTCRDRIVDLALDMDEIDRLPMVAIPHDVLRGALAPAAQLASRRRARRLLPLLLLVVAAMGVVALFQLGSVRAEEGPLRRQVVLQTAATDPTTVVDELLGGIPHTVVTDRADDRHLVVLVGDADVAVAQARLAASTTTGGRSYVIDIGATGQLPDAAG